MEPATASEIARDAGTAAPGPVIRTQDVRALPPEAITIDEITGTWSVAIVRTTLERRAVLQLAQAGVAWCLPMEQSIRRDQRGHARGRYWRLIFPGYLFICLRADADVYEIRGRVTHDGYRIIADIIVARDQRRLIDELRDLCRAADAGLLKNAETREYRPGRKCRIRSGPLEGQLGYIESRSDGQDEIMIGIEILGRSVPINVPLAQVDLE